MISASTVVICLFCFVAGGLFVYIIQRYVCSNEKSCVENCINRKNCKHIYFRDFIYVGIFAVFIIVVPITIVLGDTDNTAFISQLSFAGMISSIILSVLAIIVTLIGESKADIAKDNLVNASEKVNNATAGIEDVKEKLISELGKHDISKIDGQIETIEDILNRTLDELTKMSYMYEQLELKLDILREKDFKYEPLSWDEDLIWEDLDNEK